MVTATTADNVITLNKTWKEISDAMEAGQIVVIIYTDEDEEEKFVNPVSICESSLNPLDPFYSISAGNYDWEASSPTDYPSRTRSTQ